jgi:molecular chaperone DnaK (HSP70)
MRVSDLDEVLLVGGATRTPLIQRRLEKELGIQPRSELDPDLCVATGAAIQAAVIAGERVSQVLVDITPYTFGTSAIAELNGEMYPYTFIPLIRKNTPIPVTKSEAFYTIVDGQMAIEVNVYQGEDPDALNNIRIGAYRIEGLSDVPAGNTIVTTFSLDINGILQVTSREKRSGLEKHITIENATARFEEQEMTAARERIQALIAGEDAGQEQRESVKAQALIEKAERLLEGAGTEDRDDLVDSIEAVRDALAEGDAQALEEATAGLSDLIFYLQS